MSAWVPWRYSAHSKALEVRALRLATVAQGSWHKSSPWIRRQPSLLYSGRTTAFLRLGVRFGFWGIGHCSEAGLELLLDSSPSAKPGWLVILLKVVASRTLQALDLVAGDWDIPKIRA